MNPRKKEEDKKIKFAISIDPIIFNKMETELINKSRLVEKLLKEYYNKNEE